MSHTEIRRATALLLAVVLAACASSRPKALLPSFKSADRDVYGGWMVVERQKAKTPADHGELIAIAPDRLYLLTAAGGIEVPKSDVKEASVTLYDPKSLLANVSTGMLFALTNGLFAALTIPLWGVAGGLALHDVSVAAEITYPASPWESLAKGARFPQGMPPGLEVQSLRPRVAPPAK